MGARSSRENDFLVGVSIDGPREMHDAYRVDKGGKPTFDRVIAGLDALKRHGVEWNALTTVNSANGDHGLRGLHASCATTSARRSCSSSRSSSG